MQYKSRALDCIEWIYTEFSNDMREDFLEAYQQFFNAMVEEGFNIKHYDYLLLSHNVLEKDKKTTIKVLCKLLEIKNDEDEEDIDYIILD